MRTLLLLLLVVSNTKIYSQKNDTIREYYDGEFQPTSKSKATIIGIITESQKHWILDASYTNGKPLLTATFIDAEFRIKDGRYILYYENGNKANEGVFANNVREGIWKFYYPTGNLKDSGRVAHGQMAEKWTSWYESGTIKYIADFQRADSIEAYKTRISTTGKLNNQLPPFFLEGAWISFHSNGRLDSEGVYVDNKKEGTWKFHRENGELSSIEIYKSDKIVSMQCFDSNGIKSSSYCTLASLPHPILDKYTDLNTYILDNVQWPQELVEKGVNGQVSGHYTISKTGELIDFAITSSSHKLLSKETERVMKSVKHWIPAISHNRNIDYTLYFNIPFIKIIDLVD